MPDTIRPDIERIKTMEEIWKFLDVEYGKPNVLSKERVNYLHTFQYSKTATSESAKFNELYQCWSTVYSDLAKVNQLDALNHSPHSKHSWGSCPARPAGRGISPWHLRSGSRRSQSWRSLLPS